MALRKAFSHRFPRLNVCRLYHMPLVRDRQGPHPLARMMLQRLEVWVNHIPCPYHMS
jgi:hypothetical protein